MQTIRTDVAVIGAGSAGLVAYRAARALGKRALLIEGGAYGTTCARVGCMPSKLLIAAADAAHAAADAGGFGVHAGAVRIDGPAVMARVQAERDRFVGFVVDGVEAIAAQDRIRGHARFLDPQRLQIDGPGSGEGSGTLIEAERFVIATGSHPVVPEELQGLGERVVTTDAIFEWKDLPQSVAVIGTGAIGLEIGQALHRLGVRVAVFGRGTGIGQLSDPAVLDAAVAALGSELDLRRQTRIVSAERDAEGVLLQVHDAAGKVSVERFDRVLAATGRAPNLAALALDKAGLTLDARGMPAFDMRTMQCRGPAGPSAIFIAGDASADRPLLHEAADQGRLAGENAARYPDVRPGLRHTPLAIAFSDPQIAMIGTSFRDLPRGRAVAGAVDFGNQGRSRVMRQNRGKLRVYAEIGSGRFLGAEMIGPRAEHIAHLLAWACQSGMTIETMLTMPFYHPVVEEGLRTALRDAEDKLLHGLPEIEHCADCTPGM